MSFTYGNTRDTLIDREGFLSTAGIDYRAVVCAAQVHTSNVICAGEKDKGRGALSAHTAISDTDALVTNVRRLPLAVFTADCLPVFLYDPFQKVIAVVHAGWRGSKDKISVKALQLMCDRFNSSPENVLAGFGPALRSCCYEVGREFKNYFPEGIIERGAQMFCDLSGINKSQLLGSGVKEKNISDSGHCTSCKNFKYFSYRKEGDSAGRMISVIMLK